MTRFELIKETARALKFNLSDNKLKRATYNALDDAELDAAVGDALRRMPNYSAQHPRDSVYGEAYKNAVHDGCVFFGITDRIGGLSQVSRAIVDCNEELSCVNDKDFGGGFNRACHEINDKFQKLIGPLLWASQYAKAVQAMNTVCGLFINSLENFYAHREHTEEQLACVRATCAELGIVYDEEASKIDWKEGKKE